MQQKDKPDSFLSEMGRRGAETTARRLRGAGMRPGELPALDSIERAMAWFGILGQALAERRITHNDCREMRNCADTFIKSESEKLTHDTLNQTMQRLNRLEAELGQRRVAVVK
jgi:hypothetical protein